MILPCSCEHRGQDILYGRGNRVHNPCKPKEKTDYWRCTVCLTVKTK